MEMEELLSLSLLPGIIDGLYKEEGEGASAATGQNVFPKTLLFTRVLSHLGIISCVVIFIDVGSQLTLNFF